MCSDSKQAGFRLRELEITEAWWVNDLPDYIQNAHRPLYGDDTANTVTLNSELDMKYKLEMQLVYT